MNKRAAHIIADVCTKLWGKKYPTNLYRNAKRVWDGLPRAKRNARDFEARVKAEAAGVAAAKTRNRR